MGYSQDLIEKFIKYFLKRYKITLSKEKAEEFLESYADFFLAFYKE